MSVCSQLHLLIHQKLGKPLVSTYGFPLVSLFYCLKFPRIPIFHLAISALGDLQGSKGHCKIVGPEITPQGQRCFNVLQSVWGKWWHHVIHGESLQIRPRCWACLTVPKVNTWYWNYLYTTCWIWINMTGLTGPRNETQLPSDAPHQQT